jgi:hypothetical protein
VTWTQFLRSQAAVACDFATINTALMRRYYLLFFIDVTTREVFFAGITANPTGAWTTQTFRTEGLKICKTPARTPIANTFAERWIGSLRRELLDRTIIWTERQLEHLVHRLHRPLQRSPPPPLTRPATTAPKPAAPERCPRSNTTPTHQINPLQRPHQRIQKRCLTRHDRVSGTHRCAGSEAHGLVDQRACRPSGSLVVRSAHGRSAVAGLGLHAEQVS